MVNYNRSDMSWRTEAAPMIPIYYMDIKAMKAMFDNNPHAVSPRGLDLMMDYFEEFELFEKAALVRDVKFKLNLFDASSIVDTQLDEEEGPSTPPSKKKNDDDDDPYSMAMPY